MMREGMGEQPAIPVIKTIASQQLGIDELVAAIALQQSNPLSMVRKKQLLKAKVYQIIAAHQMRQLNPTLIEKQLETEMKLPHFNIFTFSRQFYK